MNTYAFLTSHRRGSYSFEPTLTTEIPYRQEVTVGGYVHGPDADRCAHWQQLVGVFDRVFGPIYTRFNAIGSTSYQGVPANVYELGDTYQIVCLIRGIDPESIQVTALGAWCPRPLYGTATYACRASRRAQRGGA